MKSIITKSLIVLATSLPLLTACQDEPEVGETLYPTEQENYDAKVYINELNIPSNALSLKVVQTPSEVITPDDEISFYVRLTKPVAENVTVTVAENAELATAYGNGTSALPAGAVAFSTNTVTIPAGSQVSTEPIVAKVQSTDALRELSGSGVIALAIDNSTGGVAAGGNNNAMYIVLNKVVTNFKNQSSSEIATLTKVDATNFSVTINGTTVTTLSDGSLSTDYGQYGAYDVLVTFNEPTAFRGFVFYAGYSTYFGPRNVEILTSSDGINWTSQTDGIFTTTRVSRLTTPVPFVFYSAVTCQYVKFSVYDCFWSDYGSSYDYPDVAEIEFYQ